MLSVPVIGWRVVICWRGENCCPMTNVNMDTSRRQLYRHSNPQGTYLCGSGPRCYISDIWCKDVQVINVKMIQHVSISWPSSLAPNIICRQWIWILPPRLAHFFWDKLSKLFPFHFVSFWHTGKFTSFTYYFLSRRYLPKTTLETVSPFLLGSKSSRGQCISIRFPHTWWQFVLVVKHFKFCFPQWSRRDCGKRVWQQVVKTTPYKDHFCRHVTSTKTPLAGNLVPV